MLAVLYPKLCLFINVIICFILFGNDLSQAHAITWDVEINESLEALRKGDWHGEKTIQVTVASAKQTSLLQNFICAQSQREMDWPLLIIGLDGACTKIPALQVGGMQIQCLEYSEQLPKTTTSKNFIQVMIAIILLQLGFSILYLDVGSVVMSDFALEDIHNRHSSTRPVGDFEKDLLVLMGSSLKNQNSSATNFDVFYSQNTSSSIKYWTGMEKRSVEIMNSNSNLSIHELMRESLNNEIDWGFFPELAFHSGFSLLDPRSHALMKSRQETEQKLALISAPCCVDEKNSTSLIDEKHRKETYLKTFGLWAMTSKGSCRAIPAKHQTPALPYSQRRTVSTCMHTIFEHGVHTKASWKSSNTSSLSLHSGQMHLDLATPGPFITVDAELVFAVSKAFNLESENAAHSTYLEITADIGLEGELYAQIDPNAINWESQIDGSVKVDVHFSMFVGNLAHLLFEPVALEMRALHSQSDAIIFTIQVCKLSSESFQDLTVQVNKLSESQKVLENPSYSNFSMKETQVRRRPPHSSSSDVYEVVTNPEYIRSTPQSQKKSSFGSEFFALPRTVLHILKDGMHQVERATKNMTDHIGKTFQWLKRFVQV